VSATEIIAEIKKLPASEQEEVLAFLARQRNERTGGEAAVRYAPDEDVDKAIENVMRDRADLFRRLAR
jgi:transcriptional regulator with AAA-type ATPase domain